MSTEEQDMAYLRDSGSTEYDRYITTDPEPWPDAGDAPDINLSVPYCAPCGYRHSVNSDWCKLRRGQADCEPEYVRPKTEVA